MDQQLGAGGDQGGAEECGDEEPAHPPSLRDELRKLATDVTLISSRR